MKQKEWIKYADDKPTRDDKYIVLTYSGHIVMRVYKTRRVQAGRDGFDFSQKQVTHKSGCAYWMELPDFPDGFVDEMLAEDTRSEVALKAEIKRLRERIAELENGET